MREQLLETEAVELPAEAESGPTGESSVRALPAERSSSELTTWRGEVRSAALAAAGGLVAGAATVAAVRAGRSVGGRSPVRRGRGRGRPAKVVASRSFIVDVHLLGEK